MMENIKIVKKDIEFILIKFEVLEQIVELLEDDLEALKILEENTIISLNKFIVLELKKYFAEKNFPEDDLIVLIKEINLYESAENQLRYIDQKVDDGFWKRVETMLNEELLNELLASLKDTRE